MKPKVGRNFTSERGGRREVKNISLHWLQGIFETVTKMVPLVGGWFYKQTHCMVPVKTWTTSVSSTVSNSIKLK